MTETTATCTCVTCGDCGGHGTVWFDVSGEWLGDRRCDDCDTMESCDTCHGSGISEMCDRCQWAWEEEMNNERIQTTRPSLADITVRAMLECAESGNTCSSPCPWCLNEARLELEAEARGE